MIERFDVVDMQDVPTGQLTDKQTAHEQGILHRCVAVYVFDEVGRLYVQNHKKSGLLDHSVGGHVSSGESYHPAAKREGGEELGLYDEAFSLIAEGVYSDELFNPARQTSDIKHMFGIYECHPSGSWKFKPNDEVESIYPEELETVVNQMNATPSKFTPGFIVTMAKFIEVKALSIVIDVDACRRNWGEL